MTEDITIHNACLLPSVRANHVVFPHLSYCTSTVQNSRFSEVKYNAWRMQFTLPQFHNFL